MKEDCKEVARATVSALEAGGRPPLVAVTAGQAAIRDLAPTLGQVVRWLRAPWDGLFADCVAADELAVSLTRGGALGGFDRVGLTLQLDADLVGLAAADAGARALLRLVVRHEWRRACAGMLYGAVLGRDRPGGPREALLVLVDDGLDMLDLDEDEATPLLAAAGRLRGPEDPWGLLLQAAVEMGAIDDAVQEQAVRLATHAGAAAGGAAERLRAEARALVARHLQADAALGDPRLAAPAPGAAGRLLRGANDSLRLPAWAALTAMPGPDAATARGLLAAGATELRAVPGIREHRRRALRRLQLLAAAEAAARHAGEPVAASAEPAALAAFAGTLLRGAGPESAGLARVVTADLVDCVVERAEAWLDEGAARRALDAAETALAFAGRRAWNADVVTLEALAAVRDRARAGLAAAAAHAEAAEARRTHRRLLAERGVEAARDPAALRALVDETARMPDAAPEDVLAILTAVDREWDGQFADTDGFAELEAAAGEPSAPASLGEAVRRLRGLMAVAAGQSVDATGLSLEATAEALASERLFQTVFGIEDARARAALGARALELLDQVGPTAGALFTRRGLLRRERVAVPPAEARATVHERLKALRQAWTARRDPADRDTLVFAEWCAGLLAVAQGDAAEAWARFGASMALLAEVGAGERESVAALAAALRDRGAFGDANRLLRALGPLRARLAVAVDFCTAAAAAPEGLTAEQREQAPAALERYTAMRDRFPRVAPVRVDGVACEARLSRFLQVGRGGKEGQFAALRHLFVGKPFAPFLGYHVLELDGGGGRTVRYVAKVGITEGIARAYAGAFRLLIRDAEGEMARLRGNHERELLVNRWLAAYAEDLRERARVQQRAESKARHAGDQAGAQAARRAAEAERALGDALLVPEVRVAEVGDPEDPVPLLCCELVPDVAEFPKSRFAREADAHGTLRRLRRQEARAAAALAVLHEQAKDALRSGRAPVAGDLLETAAADRVRRVRAHAACLCLLFANTDFQLFVTGGRMACIDMGELIMPEVFAMGAGGVGRSQTHRIDCAVVTEEDRVDDFLEVATSYARFLEESPQAVAEAGHAAGLPPEAVKRVAASLQARAAVLPDALALLIESGGTLYVGQGGRFLPRERGGGTKFVRRRRTPSQPTRRLPVPGAPEARPAPGPALVSSEATVDLEPAVPSPRPAPAPPAPRAPATNPYAFASESDATVHVDLDSAAGPPPPPPRDPMAPAGERDSTIIVSPALRRASAATPRPGAAPPPPSRSPAPAPATVLVAVAHPGRRAFVQHACDALGLTVATADDSMVAAARVRAGGVDVLVVDADLPEVGGAEVIRVAQTSAPAPVHTILLAPPEALADPALTHAPPDAVVTRPLHADELHARLADAVRRSS